MAVLSRFSTRAKVLTAVAAVLAMVLALGAAGVAEAGLSSTDWAEQTLPANFLVGDGNDGPALSAVSCVAGTRFCLVIAGDSANLLNGDLIGEAALVTTDGGQTWTGYATFPPSMYQVLAVSCPSVSVCWASGWNVNGNAEIMKSSDGGQTWSDVTPSSMASPDLFLNSIDCLSAATCWIAGQNAEGQDLQDPAVFETADGGASWTSFSNLPAFVSADPNGTYALRGISCTSPTQCVAVGGLNEADGTATVISTPDGGVTWSLSTDPALSGIQDLFAVSCLPGAGGSPVCQAAGSALQAAGPVEIASQDGGATWSGIETYDHTGWLNSISCVDLQHCWAAGSGTALALLGTATGGSTWSAATSDTTNEDGSVSCATASFCAATTDNGLWVTTDDGGLGATARQPRAPATAATPLGTAAASATTAVSRALPKVAPAAVWARAGNSATIRGQYRGTAPASTATVTIKPPTGATTTRTVPIGLNHYYAVTIPSVALGTTTVTFAAGNAAARTVHLHGHPAAAPSVTSLSAHAGPVQGGNTLTVTGSNLSGASAVMFGPPADRQPGTGIKVLSSTKLSVVAPAGQGAGYLTVVTAKGGPSALTGGALYSFLPRPGLHQLRPASGKAGTKVVIGGSGFAFVKAVYFGSNRATGVHVLSARELTAIAPAGQGTVAVRVVTPGGKTPQVTADRYTY